MYSAEQLRVSEEIRNRVLDAAKELSYEASHAARRACGAKTHTLGAIFPEIASGFYADVLAGIDEIAAENSFDVLAAFVGKRRSRPELVNRLLRQGRADALLVLNLDDTRDLKAEDVLAVADHSHRSRNQWFQSAGGGNG